MIDIEIPLRKLGKTGMSVSLMSVGGWQLGGAIRRGNRACGLPRFVESEKIELLKRAVEMGINFCETSNQYGQSEIVIGKFLKQQPGSLIVATKCGIRPEGGVDVTPTFIRTSVEDSLRKLGKESLDVFQITVPDFDRHDMNLAIDTLKILKKEGKICNIGVSVKRIRDAKFLLNLDVIDVMEVFYNLFDCRFNREIIPMCGQKNIGLIIKSPLNKGVLTGKYYPNDVFHPDDARSTFLDKNELEFRNLWIDSFSEEFDLNRMELRSFALRYLFSNVNVSTVPVGVRNIGQLEANVEVFRYPPLEWNTLQRIENFSEKNIGGFSWKV